MKNKHQLFLYPVLLFMGCVALMSAFNPNSMSYVQVCHTADSIAQELGYLKEGQNVSLLSNDVPYMTMADQFDSNYNSLKNKPVLFSGSYSDLTDKPSLFSGAYGDLTGKPNLFDGDYNSLTNKPINVTSFVNNAGYLTSAPVTSVNGQTGAVSLSLGAGTVTSLGVTSSDLNVSNTPVTTSGNITVNVKDQYKIQRYNGSGLITSVCKEWYGIITPSSSSGQTVDISSAGFSAIHSIQVSAANNTGSATSVPLVGIKSYTTSQITLNIVSSNNNTIASLLSPIIGLIFPSSVAGYTIHVVVKGA